MSSNHSRLCRDLIGGSVQIKSHLVLDKDLNLRVETARVQQRTQTGSLKVMQDAEICGNASVSGSTTIIEGDLCVLGETKLNTLVVEGNITGNLMSEEIQILKDQISSLNQQVAMLVTEVSQITVGNVVVIANDRGSDILIGGGPARQITFDNIIESAGGAYNGVTFTAPRTGRYFISYYAFQNTPFTPQYTQIRVNGAGVLAQNDDQTSELSGILSLTSGDVVDLITFQASVGAAPNESGLSIHSITF